MDRKEGKKPATLTVCGLATAEGQLLETEGLIDTTNATKLAVTYGGSVVFDHICWLQDLSLLTIISAYCYYIKDLSLHYSQDNTGMLVAIYHLDHLQEFAGELSR